jgi:hypothetical protein
VHRRKRLKMRRRGLGQSWLDEFGSWYHVYIRILHEFFQTITPHTFIHDNVRFDFSCKGSHSTFVPVHILLVDTFLDTGILYTLFQPYSFRSVLWTSSVFRELKVDTTVKDSKPMISNSVAHVVHEADIRRCNDTLCVV